MTLDDKIFYLTNAGLNVQPLEMLTNEINERKKSG
jgi:hypothetical protein